MSYEKANTVQKALSGSAGHIASLHPTYPYGGGRGGRGGRRGGRGYGGRAHTNYAPEQQREIDCYACGGVGHGWQTCASRLTAAGQRRLAARNITLSARDKALMNGREINTVQADGSATGGTNDPLAPIPERKPDINNGVSDSDGMHDLY